VPQGRSYWLGKIQNRGKSCGRSDDQREFLKEGKTETTGVGVGRESGRRGNLKALDKIQSGAGKHRKSPGSPGKQAGIAEEI